MPRTTVNIDAPILKDLKRIQAREHRPLGQIISDLLSEAVNRKLDLGTPSRTFRWTTRAMRARVDLEDKDAVDALLDQ